MTYEQIKNLREKEFRRLCGVKPQLFKEMVDLLKQELPKSRNRGGQPKLSIEDRLLITLEKRARVSNLFSEGVILGRPQNVDRPNHIAQSWGVHESTIAHSRLSIREATSDCRRRSQNSSSSRRLTK